MTKKILIVSGFPLTQNPRVVKEANALAAAGYDVEVLTSIFDPNNRERELARVGRDWKARFLVDNSSSALTDRLKWIFLRMRRKIAEGLHKVAGLTSNRLLGYCDPELARECVRSDADLFIIHLEQAMFAGLELIRRGRRVAVDFEDWYSEDLPEAARRHRNVDLMRKFERTLARDSVYSLATSEAMSDAIAEAFGAPKPRVVLNAFPSDEQESIDGVCLDRQDLSRLSICWFSQTIGPERGLEMLMKSTHHLRADIEIHLRGRCSMEYERFLRAAAAPNIRPHIYIHPSVSHDKLLSRIAEHDVGFAGEIPSCPSRDLTITNKIFQYLQASIPVLATATRGQQEAHRSAPEAIRLIPPDNPQLLAKAIDDWESRSALLAASMAATDASATVFNWNRSEDVILDSVSQALHLSRNGSRSV